MVTIFLHIPKTAGKTFHQIIHANYHSEDILYWYRKNSHQLIDYLKTNNNSSKMLCGHFPFGIHDYLNDKITYMTIIRNPFERVISHFNHVKRDKNHYLHKKLHADKLDLLGYVESVPTRELDNGQVRQLCGFEGISKKIGECDDSMLCQAKQNLDKYFPVVGTTENFDKFLEMLKLKLNWTIPNYEIKKTSNEKNDMKKLDSKILQTIRKHNELDIELYNYIAKKINSGD